MRCVLLLSLGVAWLATACDDTLPPIADSGGDAAQDIEQPDSEAPDDQQLPPDLIDPPIDSSCVRPDGICFNNDDCFGPTKMICNTEVGVCVPDPCDPNSPVCTGTCIPAPTEPLTAKIVAVEAWNDLQPPAQPNPPTQVIVTLEMMNVLNVDLFDVRLIDTKLISQNTASKVELLTMTPMFDGIVRATTTMEVQYKSAVVSTGASPKWSCNEPVKLETTVQYATQSPNTFGPVWSAAVPFGCVY